MLELKTTTLSSLGTAILAMIVVCVLFIADSAIVFWVVFILISMDIGVAGYLSLWGADLDPTTVVNILVFYSSSPIKCLDEHRPMHRFRHPCWVSDLSEQMHRPR